MRSKRSLALYAFLAAVWLAFSGWQLSEHRKTADGMRHAMRGRSRDIAKTLEVVIRAQGRISMVRRDRLEASLEELAGISDILGVELLDMYGAQVIAAGQPLDFSLDEFSATGERWSGNTLMVVNSVDFGARVEASLTSETLRLISSGRGPDYVMRFRPPGVSDSEFREYIEAVTSRTLALAQERDSDRPPGGRREVGRPDEVRRPPGDFADRSETSYNGRPGSFGDFPRRGEEMYNRPPPEREPGVDRRPPPDRDPRGNGDFFRGDWRGPFGWRPPWISEEEFNQMMVNLRSVHHLVLLMDASVTRLAIVRDLWLRAALISIALVAMLGIGSAWFSAGRSLDLEVRLARAQEMNAGLREMNVAAAGLAHETRNPLNIVRGMAQMVAKEAAPDSEVSSRARGIVEEVDRVASRLNEFIEYSRPRDVKLASTNLKRLIQDVARTLEFDLEDKQIQFELSGEDLSIEGDETLLRQALFNLILNASQAVAGEAGRIEAAILRKSPREAWIEIRDNGPGVPLEDRQKIFQPYFTTREEGAGLGLAVVRQIVLAHHWDVACLSNDKGETVFRISGMKIAAA